MPYFTVKGKVSFAKVEDRGSGQQEYEYTDQAVDGGHDAANKTEAKRLAQEHLAANGALRIKWVDGPHIEEQEVP